MLLIALGSLALSAITAYLIGSAFAAPRESFIRSKRGILLIVVLGLTFIALPPQLVGVDEAIGPLAGTLGSAGEALMWPVGFGKGVYIALWILTSAVAFLVGIRIWQLGTSEWRGGGNRAFDASAVSRVSSLLPIADRIEDALDTLARAGLTEKDVPKVAGEIRTAGGRFANSLPPSDGEVYRLVAARVPAAIAGQVTGLLLEGAGRREPGP